MKQTPVFYFDKYAYEARINELTAIAGDTNELLREFNRLQLFPLKTMQEITALISSGEGYIRKRLEEYVEPQKVGTFVQDPAKVVATLQLPDFAPLNELIKVVKPRAMDLQYCIFNGAAVEVTEDRKDSERKNHCKEADTAIRLDMLNAYNEAVAALQKFHTSLRNMNSAGISATARFEDVFIIEGNTVGYKEKYFVDNYRIFQPKK